MSEANNIILDKEYMRWLEIQLHPIAQIRQIRFRGENNDFFE